MKYIKNMVMRDSEKYTEKPNEITICHSFEEYLGALDKYWKYREEMFKKRNPHISRFKYAGQPDCTGQEHYLFEYNIFLGIVQKKFMFIITISICWLSPFRRLFLSLFHQHVFSLLFPYSPYKSAHNTL